MVAVNALLTQRTAAKMLLFQAQQEKDTHLTVGSKKTLLKTNGQKTQLCQET